MLSEDASDSQAELDVVQHGFDFFSNECVVTLSMSETDLSAFLDTEREMNILLRTRNSKREWFKWLFLRGVQFRVLSCSRMMADE